VASIAFRGRGSTKPCIDCKTIAGQRETIGWYSCLTAALPRINQCRLVSPAFWLERHPFWVVSALASYWYAKNIRRIHSASSVDEHRVNSFSTNHWYSNITTYFLTNVRVRARYWKCMNNTVWFRSSAIFHATATSIFGSTMAVPFDAKVARQPTMGLKQSCIIQQKHRDIRIYDDWKTMPVLKKDAIFLSTCVVILPYSKINLVRGRI